MNVSYLSVLFFSLYMYNCYMTERHYMIEVGRPMYSLHYHQLSIFEYIIIILKYTTRGDDIKAAHTFWYRYYYSRY